MKCSLLCTVFFMLTAAKGFECTAQGFFNQKGAWIKNQVKQLALWQVYIKDIEKGYDIGKEGLNAISDIKNGDSHLFAEHFNSLAEVNPQIKKYSKAVEIVLLQPDIKKVVIKSGEDYINSVFTHLLEGCKADADQLDTLLAPGKYQMTDDERITRIDRLYADIKDKYDFVKSFANDVRIMSLQKLKDKMEVQTSRLLNNIKER